MTSHAELHVSWLPLMLAAFVGLGLAAAVGTALFLVFRRSAALGFGLLAGVGLPVFFAATYCVRAVPTTARPASVVSYVSARTPEANLIPQEAIESPLPDAPSAGSYEVSAASLPEWVAAGTVREGDRTLVVVESEQFATTEAAVDDALEKASQALKRNFVNETHVSGDWPLDREIARQAIRRQFVGDIARQAGKSRFKVHRAYLQVELAPGTRSTVEAAWRSHAQRDRSLTVGGAAAGATALLALMAGWFRFADRKRPARTATA